MGGGGGGVPSHAQELSKERERESKDSRMNEKEIKKEGERKKVESGRRK